MKDARDYNKMGIVMIETLALNYTDNRETTTVFSLIGTAVQDLCVATKIAEKIASK